MVFMGYIIVSSIQLGATVDYSILLTNNYVACRKSLEKKEACIQALMLSCPSIFTSGTMTIIGMAKDRKLNMTTRNTPSMDNKLTLELSAVIVVLISCVEGVSPTR